MNGTTDNDPLEGRTNTRNSNNNSSSGSNSAINPNNSDSSNSVNRLSFSFSTTGNRLGLPTDSSTQKVGLIPARLSIGSIPRPGIPSVNSDNSNNDFNSIRRDDTAQGMRINRNITSNDSSNRGVPTLSYKSQLLSQSSFLSTNNQTRGKSILTGSSNLWGKGSSSLLRPSLFPGALSTSMQSVERHLKVDGASAIHQDYSTTSSEQKRKIDLNYSEEEQTIDSNDDSQEQDEEENDDGDDMEKEEAMQETIEGSQEMEVVTGQAVKSTAVLAEIEASNLITSPSQAVDTQIKANSRVYYYDSLSLEGFQALKKYLSLVTRDVGGYLIVPDLDDRTTEVKTNERKKGFKYTVPCFTYTDKPMVGWCKEISVALHGKSKGRTKVRYRSPIEGKSISSKVELQNYLSSSGRSIDLMTYFDFRENFCVCHVPEDKREPFIKCSYGLAGCNGWVHTYCIGLGRLTPRQIDDHLDVVCPYCTVYLEEIDQKSLFGENTLYVYSYTSIMCVLLLFLSIYHYVLLHTVILSLLYLFQVHT